MHLFRSSYYGPTVGNLIGAGLNFVHGGSIMLIGLNSLGISSELRTEIFTGYHCTGLLKLGCKFFPKLLLDKSYEITISHNCRAPGDLFELATNAFYLLNSSITISIAEHLQELIGIAPISWNLWPDFPQE